MIEIVTSQHESPLITEQEITHKIPTSVVAIVRPDRYHIHIMLTLTRFLVYFDLCVYNHMKVYAI
jgi:hypothetical protein